MNQLNISGNLTDAVEERKFDKTHLTRFTVAVNEGKESIFVPVEVWNQEHLSEYVGKGSKVLVTGSLKQERWESKDGGKRSRLVMLGRIVEFMDPPPPAEPRKESRKSGGYRR